MNGKVMLDGSLQPVLSKSETGTRCCFRMRTTITMAVLINSTAPDWLPAVLDGATASLLHAVLSTAPSARAAQSFNLKVMFLKGPTAAGSMARAG
jgi:hypothetical protein